MFRFIKFYYGMSGSFKATTIEAEITKPATGETQFTSLPNCTITEIPLIAWSKGELVESEIPFRFAPSEVQNTQLID